MPKPTGISKHEMLKMAARGAPAYGPPHHNKIIANFPVPEQACFYLMTCSAVQLSPHHAKKLDPLCFAPYIIGHDDNNNIAGSTARYQMAV